MNDDAFKVALYGSAKGTPNDSDDVRSGHRGIISNNSIFHLPSEIAIEDCRTVIK